MRGRVMQLELQDVDMNQGRNRAAVVPDFLRPGVSSEAVRELGRGGAGVPRQKRGGEGKALQKLQY